MKKYSYIGERVPRIDAIEKVTGAAQYAADLRLPGMLHVKLLKSPHAHARIVRIDTSEAEKLPGVRAILTGKEVPYKFGIYMQDKEVLAQEKVHHVGEPVVAVAADTEEIAERAVELIKVEYGELPPIFDVREAWKEGAPLVHERLHEYKHAPFIFPKPHTNIANHFKLRKGDVERGFKEADVILENEFYQPQVQNVQMETHTSIGQWLPNGQINIWTSAQSPFAVRHLLSAGLGVPIHKINVVVPYVGGGFGGKAGLHWEPLVVLLSKKVGGRPVKLVMTREEQFNTTAVRQGFYARIKTGVKRDGKIVAGEFLYVWDAGAYADYGVNIGRAAGYSCTGPYEIPNVKCDSLTIYTNHPYGTAYRGFGHAEFHFAVERQMDLVARAIGMDPVEFRLKNAALPGRITATGEKLREDAGRVDECINAVAEAIGWGKKGPKQVGGKLRGIGIAALWKAPAMPSFTSSSAILKLNEDGSVTLSISSTEIGQGTPTALAQMVAEELQMPIEKVKVVTKQETDFGPYSWQTVASRGLFMEGNATLNAARKLKEQVKGMAAQLLGVPEEELVVADEKVFVPGRPDKGLPLAKLATAGIFPDGRGIGGPVLGYGYYTAEGLTNLDPETGQGLPALMWTFGAQGAEVEVDPETGDVKVIKVVSAFDIGKAINPSLLEGQIYGGIVQGIGSALMEEFIFNGRGVLLNNNLTDYKICRAQDIPDELVFIPIENPQRNAPHGVRGIGEHPRISIEPAIANAIYDAIGVDLFEIPMTREKVWRALQKGRKNAAT
ncbi:MAG: xanthine dehydrogenase family protein molybdopterin-binding subunit [Candidatus Hodarchaeaceae archaeon]|nr:xanthine dehydrogenase family protein molybdopterin-binding subunit [Candidatus Hodarchaeaceae archaeon]